MICVSITLINMYLVYNTKGMLLFTINGMLWKVGCYYSCWINWLSKVMNLCLVIPQIALIGVMRYCLTFIMMTCRPIHACCYYDLMIELLDYVSNYSMCMLASLVSILLVFWCTCLWHQEYVLSASVWSCW